MRFITLSNYYFIDWWCNVDFRLFACWFDFRFSYSYLTWETGGLELASTIILALQANRLTKWDTKKTTRQISQWYNRTNFVSLASFYFPWKCQNISGKSRKSSKKSLISTRDSNIQNLLMLYLSKLKLLWHLFFRRSSI